MTEEMELICFQLIANSGAAKSSFVEAIQAAKKGLFEDAKAKFVEAEEAFVEAHKIHAELIQKEASGEKTEFSLLIELKLEKFITFSGRYLWISIQLLWKNSSP